MSRPRWRKVWRDLWLHKPRTLLVVLAIAVGIFGAGAVLDTWSLVRRAIRDQFRASNPASATLRTAAVDAALVARVRALPAVAAAQARRTVIASARVGDTWAAAMLFVVDDFSAIRIGAVRPEAGRWPPADGTVVVERSSLDFAHAGLGSPLVVQVGDGPAVSLPVAGVACDVGLAPGWMDHVVYGFVTRATLPRLGVPATLDELQIVVPPARGGEDRAAVRRVAREVQQVIESTGRRVTGIDVPVPGRHVHAAQMESLLFIQGAFGALALVLSGLLVINLVTAMLAGQVREIGVMKALGAGAGQIAGMYLGMALLLGVAACSLGIPAAALAGRAYAAFTAGMLNFSLAGVSLPVPILLLQLAAGALLPVAAAAVPVLRGCRMPVGAALRDFGIAPRAVGRVAGPRGSGRLARPLLLALRNTFRRRQRLALTLITLSCGGAVYLGAVNLRAAIRGSVDLLFAAQRFDLSVRLARPYPAPALEAAAAKVAGVRRAEAWAVARAAVSHPDGTQGSSFPISAPPPSSQLLAPLLDRGRWPRDGDGNALAVSRRLLADEPELALGRELTLSIDGRPARWRVVGVVEAGPTAAAYAARVPAAGASLLAVAADASDPAARLDLLQRLRSALTAAGFAVRSGDLTAQQRRSIEDHLLMIAAFLGAMGQLLIVVGGLGLASTMSLAVLERTREIGVLRAIGARHRTIFALVQVEALVIALLSWLAALPLSIPMSVVLGRAFGRIMFRVPLILLPQPGGVLRWAVLAAVVAVLAAAWPARRATRIPTAAALAYE